LLDGLRSFGLFRKRWAVLEGMAWFVIAGPGMLLVWFVLDWLKLLSAWPRVAIFGLACVACAAAFAARLVPAMARRVRPEREALVVEALHGNLDNLLIGAFQLGMEKALGRGLERHSPLLVEALVRSAQEKLLEIQPRHLVDLKRARRAATGACVIVAAWLALALAAPGAVLERKARLRDGWLAVLDALFPVTFVIEPGDTAVVKGAPITLSVTVKGARRPGVVLVMTDSESGVRTNVVLSLQSGRASHAIDAVERTFSYFFAYASRTSRAGTISVGERPEISAISYELVYPAYVGQPPRTLTGRMSRLQALAGTSILVSFAATTELHPDLSRVEWLEGDRQSITINGRFGHFAFVADRPNRATIMLTGRYGPGFEMSRPLSFEVAVEKDQPPTVALGVRKDKLVMFADEAAAFAVPYTAEDDFGVAEVTMSYRIDTIDALLGREPREGVMTRAVEPASERVNGKFAEVFKALDPALQPGDRVRIELSARDNNTETGPGVGRSRVLEIVIVRPDLAQFVEKAFGFQQTALLAGLKKVDRATNLLIEPERTTRTEKDLPVEKRALDARLNTEPWPSGAEDAVADYFRLLSGAR